MLIFYFYPPLKQKEKCNIEKFSSNFFPSQLVPGILEMKEREKKERCHFAFFLPRRRRRRKSLGRRGKTFN